MSVGHINFNLREHCRVNSKGAGDRFVGIKVDSDTATVYFPIGYDLPDNDGELRRDIKNLFHILTVFTEPKERVWETDNTAVSQAVTFPLQAYINIINDYLDRNGAYYAETTPVFRVARKGKTDWGKTIKTQMPTIQGDSLLYLNRVVRTILPDMARLITQIHKYCVYESFLHIGWLYTTHLPDKPDISLDKNLFLSTLSAKFNDANNDNDKRLFHSMMAMITFCDSHSIGKRFYFGTDRFEIVWERLIDRMFGVPHKSDFFPHASWTERYGKNKDKPVSALEPDTVMIYEDNYYVLDAKYYRYGVEPEDGVRLLPQSVDINKQITYGEYVHNKKAAVGANVFNAFIMPYNRHDNSFATDNVCLNVAEAVGNWKGEPSKLRPYEKIQGILLDTRYLLKNYEGNHDIDRSILASEIRKFFSQ